MTFYPKEGLITLHQSLNPPINQTITEELQKPGYGEFITETELNEALSNIETLTTEQGNKLNELLPYNIGENIFFPDTPKYAPFIVTIESSLNTKIGKNLDFRHNEYPVPYTARISYTGNNNLAFPIITADAVKSDSFFAYSIKPQTNNSNIVIRKHDNQNILEFKDDRTTQFYGEISTPTFNSNEINETIGNIQQDITDLNTSLNTTAGFVADIQTEISLTINPNISNLQTDLNATNEQIGFLETDILDLSNRVNTTENDIYALQASVPNKATGIVPLPT